MRTSIARSLLAPGSAPAIVAISRLLGLASVAHADDARAQWRAGGETYVGVPFGLDLLTDGFADSPQPDVPDIVIPGASVKLVGAQPNVARSIQIINGQRSESTRVQWA